MTKAQSMSWDKEVDLLVVGSGAGGLLSALVAPLVFNSVLEYPLVLCVCAVLVAWRAPKPAAVVPGEPEAKPATIKPEMTAAEKKSEAQKKPGTETAEKIPEPAEKRAGSC